MNGALRAPVLVGQVDIGVGPVGDTEGLSLRVFNETFLYWRVGQASALGVIIFALNAIFSLVYVRVLRTTPGA